MQNPNPYASGLFFNHLENGIIMRDLYKSSTQIHPETKTGLTMCPACANDTKATFPAPLPADLVHPAILPSLSVKLFTIALAYDVE